MDLAKIQPRDSNSSTRELGQVGFGKGWIMVGEGRVDVTGGGSGSELPHTCAIVAQQLVDIFKILESF